jgi:uncharacterized membrane protein YcaP (DUF421 family)
MVTVAAAAAAVVVVVVSRLHFLGKMTMKQKTILETITAELIGSESIHSARCKRVRNNGLLE